MTGFLRRFKYKNLVGVQDHNFSMVFLQIWIEERKISERTSTSRKNTTLESEEYFSLHFCIQ